MKAIILAAGVGKRMGDITEKTPKCLLVVGKRPMLVWQTDFLHRCGIDDITVVIGKEGACWNDETYDLIKSICKKYIINEKNVSKKRGYTLFKGLESLNKGPVLLIDGDLFFDKVVIDKMIESEAENIMLVKKLSADSPERKIIVGKNNKIIKMGTSDYASDKSYIYGGFMKVGKDLFKDIKKEMNNAISGDFSVSQIIDRLAKVHDIDILAADNKWVNINTQTDLKLAGEIAFRKDKAVIWDLDGVILDSEPFQIIAYKKAFGDQGVKIKDEDYSKNTGRKDMFQRICREYDVKCDFNRWYKTKNKIYWELIEKKAKLFPGVLDLLSELTENKYKVAASSSTSRRNLLFILNKLDIRNYFDEIVGLEDVKKGKPNPEIFIKTADKLSVKRNCCVVIEDSIHGILAAKKAGMKCIAVTAARRIDEDLSMADMIVKTLEGINVKKIDKLIK